MRLTATVANTLWAASNVPAWLRFLRALKAPRAAQRQKLHGLLSRNADTAFGKAHRLAGIASYNEFCRRVPLSGYDSLEPWIARIQRGEQRILTVDPVTHLVPTSGSTGARKLIPFTAGLQREFNAAIGPWHVDLVRECPALLGGRAYWSITPVAGDRTDDDCLARIGFASDSSYLGGARRRLAEAVMAVPASMAEFESLEEFRFETLLRLLLCRDLRLISVWHPSFLTLLLDDLPLYWDRLIAAIADGTDSTPAWRRRAFELREPGPLNPQRLWPSLALVSCWGDAAAEFPLERLRSRFPDVLVQPKGLIATECLVSLPFQGQYPLAVCSHFFEFIDSQDRVHPIEGLQKGEEYEVVTTTAGGLWRYRTGDRARVTGFLEGTPCVKFVGRGASVSDRFGEKISETFVAEALREVFGNIQPRFALLAPDEDTEGWRYTLYVEESWQPHWAESLDRALRRNPHYAYCRELGQLLPARIFGIAGGGYEVYARRMAANGARLGAIKPAMLSRISGWSEVFQGAYAVQRQEVASF